MRWPWARSTREQKAVDALPEWLWEQLQLGMTDLPLRTQPYELERAVGLPAVLAVIRLLSHAAGMVPFLVLRDGDDGLRARARDTWQWRLLQNPGPETTAFALQADLAANFLGRGNAYVRKLKPSTPRQRLAGPTPRVTELLGRNASYIRPFRTALGGIAYEDNSGVAGRVNRGPDEIIHVRSFSLTADGLEGIAPITAARLLVSGGIKRQQFEERHLANGIFPSIGLKFPPGVSPEDGERWIKAIEARHKGSPNAGKIIGVGDGAELVPIPISLEDAQFAETTRLTIEQCASMYQVPLSFFTPEQPPTDTDWRLLLTFALGPILEASAQSFGADRDLFDETADGEHLDVATDPDVLLKLDPEKKANVQKTQVQSGLRLADELRADDGYGPLPPVPDDWSQAPGAVPQITPVGGAPNPTAPTSEPPPQEPPA